MPCVSIITDTDSSLPPDVADRYHIIQVPITVQFGQQSLATGVDIDDAQLFARVDREGQLPATSAPSPGQFASAYEQALASGADAIVCICVSSKISGTYNAAVVASKMFPDRDITVVDSYSVSMGQGFMVLAAAELAAQGASVEAIVARAQDVGRRAHLYGALATLKYLAMSGRIGYLAARMANVLNIRPILTLADGKLEMLDKVRTRKRAWAKLVELTEATLGGRPMEKLALLHVNAREEVLAFGEMLRQTVPYAGEPLVCELTPGLSVHTGAGMIGLVLVVGT